MAFGLRSLVLSTLLCFVCIAPALAEKAPLSEGDCLKCHETEIRHFQENGGAHKAFLTCRSCHVGHPPRDMEVIRPCSDCHKGKPHVDHQGPCLPCHRDPHRPMQLTLAKEAVAACLDCHPAIGNDFAQAPGQHARFACTACHPRHPEAIPCGECHLPHTAGDAGDTCRQCHPPHRPQTVEFDQAIDSRICAGCHADLSARFEQEGGRHRQPGCAGCHAGAHGTIPECRQCHPEPHPAGILAQFPKCSLCHVDPHSPNR